MIVGETLFDYAARSLCPEDADEGRRTIADKAKRFVWRARFLAFLDYITIYVGAVLLVVPIIDLCSTRPYALSLDYAVITLGCLLFAWPLAGKRAVQNRTNVFTGGQRYSGELPAALETLLEELSSGLIPTRRELKAGEQDSGAVRTSTKEILGSLIPKETYSNRYALLLLAPDPKMYGYVWPRQLFSRIKTTPIYVAWEKSETELAAQEMKEVTTRLERTADINAAMTDQLMDGSKQFAVDVERIHTAALAFMRAWDIADAQENKNTAKMDQWLVGDADLVFAVGVDAFIKAEIDYKKDPLLENVYKYVFWEGRRQLQKGAIQGDHKAVVTHILVKLERMPGSPTKGRDDFQTIISESTITKLLRGYRMGRCGERDITGYFNKDRHPTSPTKSTT